MLSPEPGFDGVLNYSPLSSLVLALLLGSSGLPHGPSVVPKSAFLLPPVDAGVAATAPPPGAPPAKRFQYKKDG